jgi:hypothetical protein
MNDSLWRVILTWTAFRNLDWFGRKSLPSWVRLKEVGPVDESDPFCRAILNRILPLTPLPDDGSGSTFRIVSDILQTTDMSIIIFV